MAELTAKQKRFIAEYLADNGDNTTTIFEDN